MQYFPLFLDLTGRRVVVAGGGATAAAKLRLVLRTPAEVHVLAAAPCAEIAAWAAEGRLVLHRRSIAAGDARGAALVYAASGEAGEDARAAALARADGALVNVVDDLALSDVLTPAIVDRGPVTVAIGTSGTGPVLARRIKAAMEETLPAGLGALAAAAGAFRAAAEALPQGRARRDLWAEWYDSAGPRALAAGGEAALPAALAGLLARHLGAAPRPGRVDLVGAGPGDPDLLTLRARRLLDAADVVIHDRLVPQPILELARREATLLAVGKEGFGPSVPQAEINRLMVEHARAGAQVVRLKSGDPGIFGRLDEEIAALDAAGVEWAVVPGITAAAAAAAAVGQGLTQRGRNSALRLLTGHDVAGFAEHDWRALARPGEVAAIYMGRRAARFLQGRLIMHGADPETPVAVVENASQPGQRIRAATLAGLPEAAAATEGPAVILYGIVLRRAGAVADAATLPGRAVPAPKAASA
ncbi:MAG: siroheme synthase CysG [Rhodobacteraceae bacterium]|nr:siroheme synthase CysG [Paracoccaceae bacterium]